MLFINIEDLLLLQYFL